MHILNSELTCPPLERATRDGLLCIGGDLSPERLLLAYRSGIFPWYSEGDPICWWSPPERMVVFPEKYHAPKSLRNVLNRRLFTTTFNKNFERVIEGCRYSVRNGQDGTWLTQEMHDAYVEMHRLGYAKSVEVWQDDELVGGLYGLDIDGVFCGESMFSKVSNASKYAFAALIEKLRAEGYRLLDCQVYNHYLESLGAELIPRSQFIRILESR